MTIDNIFRTAGVLAIALAGLCVAGGSRAETGQDTPISHAEVAFAHLGAAEGLPNETVTSVGEDGSGVLWVGTMGGLARWDGYRFHSYVSDDRESAIVSQKAIQALHADSKGRLWVGTQGGDLARYEAQGDLFFEMPKLGVSSVDAIADDEVGWLWVATDRGLLHLDPATGKSEKYLHDPADPRSIPSDRIWVVFVDRGGTLWVGTDSGLVRRGPNDRQFTSVPLGTGNARISCVTEDAEGRIWVGTQHDGVRVLIPGQTEFRPVLRTDQPVSAGEMARVRSIVEVSPGEIWFGSAGQGIISLNTATWRTRIIRHDPLRRTSLAHDLVWTMHRDRSGLVWAGTAEGLDRADPGQKAISTVYAGTGGVGGESTKDVMAVLAAAKGRIWLGLGNGEVDIIDPSGDDGPVTSLHPDPGDPEHALPKDHAFALLELPTGEIFIGTGQGLYRSDSSGRRISRIKFPGARPDMKARALGYIDGAVWIAAEGDGIWRFDPKTGGAKLFGGEALNSLTTFVLLPDPSGKLWVGTNKGVTLLDPSTGMGEHILSDPADPRSLSVGQIMTMALDDRGRLWVGTGGGGISVMEGRGADGKPRFRRLGPAQGLPDSIVDKLLPDGRGKMWASTDNGLASIDAGTFDVRAFRRAEGVVVSLNWIGSGDRTPDGRLIFGGVGGITLVRPDLIQPWTYLPPLVITDFQIGGQPAHPGSLAVVPASDKRSLAVQFSALDYSAPERNRYQYRLDGFDKDWIETDWTRRAAVYTNLPPGTFTLRLRGSNRDGAWSASDLKIPIEVRPHWFETIWFRLLVALAGIAGVIALLQARTRYLRARQRFLEEEVAHRTLALRRSSDRIRSLLDNSNEGFLSFGADLIIEQECSRACASMLGEGLPGKQADQVLFGEDPVLAELFRETVRKVVPEGDRWKADLILSLLPAELDKGGLNLKTYYKRLDSGQVMVVLSDVTEARRLAQHVEEEHRRLALIVAAITESREFFATLNSYQVYFEMLPGALREKREDPIVALRELYRQVHTFKGNLGQFHFKAAPNRLHELERQLTELRRQDGGLTLEQVIATVAGFEGKSALDADLAILRDALGEDFLEQGSQVRLSAEKALELRGIASHMLEAEIPAEVRSDVLRLYSEINRLCQVALKDALAAYDRVIFQAAERLEKDVKPLQVVGGEDVWLDPEVYGSFMSSLVHVFRNSVVHGIEYPDERQESGKDTAGVVLCSVESDATEIHLAISDDGGGIDAEALREKAVALSLVSPEDAAKLSREETLDLVFLDSLSTRTDADDLSGRGVGLAAVRAEARALGGEARIQSVPGKWTRITISLPKIAAGPAWAAPAASA